MTKSPEIPVADSAEDPSHFCMAAWAARRLPSTNCVRPCFVYPGLPGAPASALL